MSIQREKEELISVIIPVYKVERYIGKCLESVQKQTYSNLEILVINDGSPDRSVEIVKEYAKTDSRIQIINKENGGLSDARNVGIEKAKGSYILLVDGDDYIDEKMIETMHMAMQSSESNLCLCGINIVDEKGNNVETDSFKAEIKSGMYTKCQMYEKITNIPNWFYVTAWNKLYKKEIFEKIKYPKGKIHEDEFVIHHIINSTNKIICLENKFYYYVQRDNSIMHTSYNINRLDSVEALLDRAEFFLNNNYKDYAIKLLKRARINFIIGYITLKKSSNDIKVHKNRLRQLHYEYCRVYKKILKQGIPKEENIRLWTFSLSIRIGIVCSKNFWDAFRVK